MGTNFLSAIDLKLSIFLWNQDIGGIVCLRTDDTGTIKLPCMAESTNLLIQNTQRYLALGQTHIKFQSHPAGMARLRTTATSSCMFYRKPSGESF